MNKHDHVIMLNGRRYNAKTGESLSHPAEPARAAAPAASHHTPAHKPVPAAPSHQPAARKAARQTAGHVAAHQPKPARTLMRQAVKKPPASMKRRIRVQGHLESGTKQPAFEVPVRSHQLRYRAAKSRKVRLISHFSPNLFTVTTVVTTKPAAPAPSLVSDRPIDSHAAGPHPTMRAAFAPKPRNTAELLEYAVRYADSPHEADEPVRRRHTRKRILHRRTHAVAH